MYYWITAASERLVYDYVADELLPRSRGHDLIVRTEEVSSWITGRLAKGDNATGVANRVAQGLLAAFRDFGILEGTARKRIAPPICQSRRLPISPLPCTRRAPAVTPGEPPGLDTFSPVADRCREHHFLEADRSGILKFQAAGKIVHIRFPRHSYKEMADAIAIKRMETVRTDLLADPPRINAYVDLPLHDAPVTIRTRSSRPASRCDSWPRDWKMSAGG